eukprot:gene29042-35450_t
MRMRRVAVIVVAMIVMVMPAAAVIVMAVMMIVVVVGQDRTMIVLFRHEMGNARAEQERQLAPEQGQAE